MPRRNRPIIERFWAKVDISGSYFIWLACKDSDGYGLFTIEGEGGSKTSIGAHKLAYMLVKGDTYDKYVLHTCDNPACVNPDHLYLGTQFDNMRDCKQRGRLYTLHRGLHNAIKTHCPRGHVYSENNLLIYKNSNGISCRGCRICQRAANRRSYARSKKLVSNA